jgi:hypothetical protein
LGTSPQIPLIADYLIQPFERERFALGVDRGGSGGNRRSKRRSGTPRYADAVARELEVAGEFGHTLEIAARLQDIGKIAIP